MGDVVNLNSFRKRRDRQQADRTAAENRVRFGRTGAEKAAIRREGERDKKDLEGKRLNDDSTTT
ncbi:MAG: DUF4169 family protein [Alphaproteobacteria bacterium]|nr:DUF4169 family protein [Alphaproteobacteria bacterium]